jgi:xanthine dehydrogenase YagS FAD-binding subunit
MRPFDYFAAREASEAVRLVLAATSTGGDSHEIARPQYLAGGTTLLDLMKLDVMRPGHVVASTLWHNLAVPDRLQRLAGGCVLAP